MTANKPSIVPVAPVSIAKPEEFSLDRFKSTRGATIAGVETLLTALPCHSLSQAKDWVRLHPDEAAYWSQELCFVNVPIQGQSKDTLHLIDEQLAMQQLPGGKILRFRLALATKPYDKRFLCHVPSQNTNNAWNQTNLQACEQAKTRWTMAVSRREEGVDGYEVKFARDQDAFPEPNWGSQALGALIAVTFCQIISGNDPGLLRLLGAKQSMS